MTPKKILREVVLRLFNGVDMDDLSKEERRLVQTLKKHGLVRITKEYVCDNPLSSSEEDGEDYDFVYPNWRYFDEDKSPAVEEPEET